MIFDLILGAIIGIFTGVLGLIPSYQLPDTLTSLGSQLGGALAAANGIFPVVTMGVCIAAFVGFRIFMWLWTALVWVYDKVPMKGT